MRGQGHLYLGWNLVFLGIYDQPDSMLPARLVHVLHRPIQMFVGRS